MLFDYRSARINLSFRWNHKKELECLLKNDFVFN